MVADYINGGGCLKVGLEIPSDQQEVMDSAMKGDVSMSDIQIDNVIDHNGYREMLVSFSEQIIAGKCLSVYAIDAPKSMPVAKDAWMEKEVVRIMGDKPVVLLVGNKHAVKNFYSTNDESRKLLAQRLCLRSFGVASVLQDWKPGQCGVKTVEMFNTAEDNKSGIYVKEAIGELSAEMPETVSMVTDGVLVWSCERVTVKEEVNKHNGSVSRETLSVDIKEYEIVERDVEVLKKIKWGIKHEYPVEGMNKAEAREALGEPEEVEKAGQVEQWVYQCFDDDGFYYNCFVLIFSDETLVKFNDL